MYIGKATSLKQWVKPYFTGIHNVKTQKLIAQVEDIRVILTDPPLEALLLENTLIKEHQPKYNILLKDRKTYPYLLLTDEEYPRLVKTRKKEPNAGSYYGPYPTEGAASLLLDTIHRLFPIVKLPNCSF
ncbi:hypothetical protein ACFDTO_38130 [Microbacteriaceae bacterium 4G12]